MKANVIPSTATNSKSISPADFLLAVFVVAIWGANAAIAKLAVPQIPVFAFLAGRFLLTGLIFLPFIRWQRPQLWPLFKITILVNVLHYGFIFSAMPHLDASTLSILQQIQTPVAVLLSYFIFRETLSLRVWTGIAFGFIGIVMIKGFGHISVEGFFLALAGSTMWAVASIEMKKLHNVPLATFMGVTTLLSCPFLGLISLILHEPVLASFQNANLPEISAVLAYQIILGSLAMMLWKFLLKANPIQKVVPVSLLQPVFGIIAGRILFHDNLSAEMLAGGMVATLGVALVLLPNRQDKIVVDGVGEEYEPLS